MSDVNSPEMELTENNTTFDIPENFMDSVLDDNFQEPVEEVEEIEAELEQSETPDEPEDEVVEDTDVEEDESDEDSEDEVGDDLEEDSEEDKDEEVWAIEDLDTNQVIRLTDGTETNIQDLIDGQMMQSDYTKKTQALSDERKSLDETKVKLSTRSERMKGEHEQIVDAWKEELTEAEEQFRTDPTNPEAKQRYDVAQVNVNAAQKQFNDTEATYNELKRESDAARLHEAEVYAVEHIANWSLDYAEDLLKYAKEATGVDDSELSQFITGATLVLLDKARKFDDGTKVATKKRTTAKKKTKSLKKTASKSKKVPKASKKAKAESAALDRYAESGDFRDLDSLFGDDFIGEFE